MQISIKGITNSDIIRECSVLGVADYSFDLRPKSFNFVQAHKIKTILMQYPHLHYSLLFENEKDFMVHALHDDISKKNHHLQ